MFFLKVLVASVFNIRDLQCFVFSMEKREVGLEKGGWAGFDRGAGLIAIMIWPIRN